MSTMLSFANNNLSNNFLTKDELRHACPSAFSNGPTNPQVSDRYVHANTMTVVDDLAKLGWYPVEAKQCRAKKNSSGIRSFHMLAFQNPDVKIIKDNGSGIQTVDAYPRIILTNSHDGFNSFKFMVGLFRLVCSNGLCVSDGEFENVSIRHINYDFETLRLVVTNAIKRVPDIVCTMNTMRKVETTEETRRALATEVAKIRKGVEADEKFDIDEATIMDILSPVRNEDNANDLWTVFNVCQEKMIKGGYSSIGKNNRARRQRGITSIKKDLEYNQRLWAFAMQWVPATAEA